MLALELWRRLEHDTGAALLETVGGLDFGVEVDAAAHALAACGVPYEMLTDSEVERRFPGVSACGEPALFQADAAMVRADATMSVLAQDAERHGAVIRAGVTVHAIEPSSEHIDVVTSHGRLRAQSVVVTAGPWTADLVRPLEVRLDAHATLQSPAYLEVPGESVGRLPTVIDVRGDGSSFYSVPEPDRSVVKGGVHEPGPTVDLDGSRGSVVDHLERFAAWGARRYRGVRPEAIALPGCIYTWLPDSRFHLARHGRLVVASCCSGRGFKFVPLTGLWIAAMVRGILGGDAVAARAGDLVAHHGEEV
jgi:sarcosine oxidase